MRIFVKVKTRAKKVGVEKKDATHFLVAVRELPIDGKANVAVVKALAKYLGVAQSCITLRSGASAQTKVFDIIC